MGLLHYMSFIILCVKYAFYSICLYQGWGLIIFPYLFDIFVSVSLFTVETKKCSRGFAGEAVTGEKLGLQSGSTDEHWAGESAPGTQHSHLSYCDIRFSLHHYTGGGGKKS